MATGTVEGAIREVAGARAGARAITMGLSREGDTEEAGTTEAVAASTTGEEAEQVWAHHLCVSQHHYPPPDPEAGPAKTQLSAHPKQHVPHCTGLEQSICV